MAFVRCPHAKIKTWLTATETNYRNTMFTRHFVQHSRLHRAWFNRAFHFTSRNKSRSVRSWNPRRRRERRRSPTDSNIVRLTRHLPRQCYTCCFRLNLRILSAFRTRLRFRLLFGIAINPRRRWVYGVQTRASLNSDHDFKFLEACVLLRKQPLVPYRLYSPRRFAIRFVPTRKLLTRWIDGKARDVARPPGTNGEIIFVHKYRAVLCTSRSPSVSTWSEWIECKHLTRFDT